MFLLVILLLGWLNSVVGKPCPSNSLFLFSQSHKESVCMCTPSFQCHGDCISGHDANPNAFKSSAAGFLPDCVDCYCQHNQNQHQSPNLNGNGVKITDVHTGKSIYDHKDILFQAYCFVDKEVTPPVPKALKSLNWFHIPKQVGVALIVSPLVGVVHHLEPPCIITCVEITTMLQHSREL
eukprot:m.95919 g.95919  ORF g.95919 m.95919 type:complete len:180 (-) comp8958_c0_seq33:1353-1892(-)